MTETTTHEATVITAQDRRALLHATDGITFHLHDGQGSIHAHKSGRHTSDGFDQYHTVWTDSTVRDYNAEYHWQGDNLSAYASFHMEHGWDDTLRTLIARITVGSTLTLEWTASNNSDNTRSVGWHRDELRLRITKKSGASEVYLVEVRTGPDNSARMVRRVRS